MSQLVKEVKVYLTGSESLEWSCNVDSNGMENFKFNLIGCLDTLDAISKLRKSYGEDIRKWPMEALPEKDHTSLLIKKMILVSKDQYDLPYKDEEICHCRKITTKKVEEAILWGARSREVVSAQTGASTSCGVCALDVEAMIKYMTSI